MRREAPHRHISAWRPGMLGLILLLWAADVAPSHGQGPGVVCPWEAGEGSGTTFTNRIELASVPRRGSLDPSDVIVSWHPPGSYGVTRERSVPFGCGSATEEIPECDLRTTRVRVTEGIVGAVFTLRSDRETTEQQANVVRTVDGFDVFEFSGVGLSFGAGAESRFVFSATNSGALAFFPHVCRIGSDFDPFIAQDVPCVFEPF